MDTPPITPAKPKKRKAEGDDDHTYAEPPQGRRNGEPSGHSNPGGEPDPFPFMSNQHLRRSHSYTFKNSGTIFVPSARGPNQDANNYWIDIPWEFAEPWVPEEQVKELVSKALYWRTNKTRITFKNPLCLQKLGDSTSNLITVGENKSAQLFGYMDGNMIFGIQDSLQHPDRQDWSEAEYEGFIQSIYQHGYKNTTAALQNGSDVPFDCLSANMPDVLNIGMGNGKGMTFEWTDHGPYWRSTSEFRYIPTHNVNDPKYIPKCFTRWDQYCGWIRRHEIVQNPNSIDQRDPTLFYTKHASSFGSTATNKVDWVEDGTMREFEWYHGQADSYTKIGIYPVTYGCPNPQPKIMLQLQPQMGAFGQAAGASLCQVQFEIEIEIQITGFIPRMSSSKTSYIIEHGNWFYGAERPRNAWNTLNLYTPLILEQDPTDTPDPPTEGVSKKKLDQIRRRVNKKALKLKIPKPLPAPEEKKEDEQPPTAGVDDCDGPIIGVVNIVKPDIKC